MIHRIRHQSRDYYREKSFLLHTYTFLCEHSRKTASFYHEFFTAKKISLSLFPCTPPSRCKRWSISILSFCPSPICYFSFIFAYTPKRSCYHAFFSLSSFATELLNSEVFTAPFFLRIFRNNKAELFTAKIFIFPLSFAVQKGLLLQILDFIPVNILITKPITWKKSFFRSKRRFFHLSWHEIISVWRKRNLRFQMKEPPLSRKESPL